MSLQLHQLCEFGPFRFDPIERLLLRDAQAVPLTPKAFDLLTALVARAGRLVTKEELLQEVWSGTFVEEANLSYHVSLLRKALGDDAVPHHYIETVMKRGYRFMAPIQLLERAVVTGSGAPGSSPDVLHETVGPPGGVSGGRLPRRAFTGIAFVIVAALSITYASVLIRDRLAQPTVNIHGRRVTQLTFNAGLQWFPTWSPDGERIAYTSERSGNLDIWAQQVIGGPPVQLTNDPAADWMPDWSPDGSHIVFRSERGGGGLFLVSALGGPVRRLAPFGYRPLWSPDGSRVLFYETPPRWQRFVPRLFTVADDGRSPTPVAEKLPRPLDTCCWRGYGWHPDSRRFSVFWGSRRPAANDVRGPGGWRFWTFGVDDGSVVRSEIAPEVLRNLDEHFRGNSGWFGGLAWAPTSDAIYLNGGDGQAHVLWRVTVDPIALRWVQGPDRVTTGPGSAVALSLSRNGRRLAFSTVDPRVRLYSFPLDAAAARLAGRGVPLPGTGAVADTPDVSPDGRQLVYVGEQRDLRIRSLATEKDTVLFEGDEFDREVPRWSHDGSSLLYVREYRAHSGSQALVRLNVASGREELITSSGSNVLVHGDWTADGRWIVATAHGPSPGRWQVILLPTAAAPHAETEARVIVDDPTLRLLPHRLSPDGRWVTLCGGASGRSEGSALFVKLLTGGPLLPVAAGPSWEWQDWPVWAPDGRTLYFVSDRSGFFDVWARRFDPSTGPVGPVIQITSLDNPARMIFPTAGGIQQAIAVSGDRLVVPVFENAGNIWMIDNIDH
jgi:Tol biopolymer transport system component/DNA-binding winged helix-turn-helix (wHTH) protein